MPRAIQIAFREEREVWNKNIPIHKPPTSAEHHLPVIAPSSEGRHRRDVSLKGTPSERTASLKHRDPALLSLRSTPARPLATETDGGEDSKPRCLLRRSASSRDVPPVGACGRSCVGSPMVVFDGRCLRAGTSLPHGPKPSVLRSPCLFGP